MCLLPLNRVLPNGPQNRNSMHIPTSERYITPLVPRVLKVSGTLIAMLCCLWPNLTLHPMTLSALSKMSKTFCCACILRSWHSCWVTNAVCCACKITSINCLSQNCQTYLCSNFDSCASQQLVHKMPAADVQYVHHQELILT